MEDLLKTNLFASKMEERLRLKTKTDLSAAAFDYKTFLNQVNVEPASIEVMPPSTKGLSAMNDILDAENKAALSGKFDPNEILKAKVPLNKKRKILSGLSQNCVIDTTGRSKWLLNTDKRLQVLNKMIREGKLEKMLGIPLPKPDAFGKMLRKLLTEKEGLRTDKLKRDDLVALVSVLETLHDLEIPKPAIADVKAMIPVQTILDEYNAISIDFVGRSKELQQLHQFIIDNSQGNITGLWKGIVVTGLGGVGKSTLLAKFLSDLMKDNKAVVSVLDFDRPGITAADVFWLAQEIMRQIALQFPQLKNELTNLRNNVRNEKTSYASTRESFSPNDQAYDLIYTAMLGTRQILTTAGLDQLPFLIILDTVEEVAQNGDTPKLIEWIHRLADILQPLQVKVIFSGRLYDQQLAQFTMTSQVYDEAIKINEFDADIAAIFLQKLGLSKLMSSKVINAELFPLRPLELKLLVRLLKESKVSLADITKELKQNKGDKNSKALFTGIIYRRVLMRIADTRVRAIAYPGLVLRYITAELILNVLQPALGLKPMTQTDAQHIVTVLESLSWLAYSENGRIWHRKDLRRSMLQLMILQNPEKTERIRDMAIQYFDSRNTAEDTAEAIYHRLMQTTKPEQGDHFKLSELKNAYSHISMDMADMPPAAIALLKYANGLPLINNELYLLPTRYLKEAYHKAGKQLVAERKFSKAYELYQKGKKLKVFSDIPKDDLFDNWQLETLFSVMQWDEAKKEKNLVTVTSNFSLIPLVNYIYPGALISPEALQPARVEQLLLYSTKNRLPFGSVTQKAEQALILSRLAMCFTVLHGSGRLSQNAINCIKGLVDRLPKTELSPSLQKSYSLFHMICYGKPLAEHLPGGSLLRLDKEWLQRLRSMIAKEHYSLVDQTVKAIISSGHDEQTARHFLGNFDGLVDNRKQWHNVKVKLKGKDSARLYELFQGPDPAFRDSCRYAILDAFKTSADIHKLVELMKKVIRIPLSDLTPIAMITTIKDNHEFALEPFIEIIDRSWQMEKFLQLANKAKPASKKIATLLAAYKRWQAMLKKLISNKSKPASIKYKK